MKKRLLSVLLALCMALTLFPGKVWAVNESGAGSSRAAAVEDELGYRIKSYSFAPGEMKVFSFTPDAGNGLYMLDIWGSSNADCVVQIESGGAPVNSIQDTSSDYIVPLREGQQYMVKVTNAESTSMTIRAAAVRLGDIADTVSIPGSVNITGHYEGDLCVGAYNYYELGADITSGYPGYDSMSGTTSNGYFSIKISQDGWYSFFVNEEVTAREEPCIVAVYTEAMEKVDSGYCYGAYYGYLGEGCAPVSMYLTRGNYVVQMRDENYTGCNHGKTVFVGKQASFSSITETQDARISFMTSEFTPSYVTFTPAKNGTYTFSLSVTEDYETIDKMELFTSDHKSVAGAKAEYEGDEYSCLSARLTAPLTAGKTYYLKLTGYAENGGAISVALQSETGVGDPQITSLYPASGSTFDFANSTADTRPRIFFDREVAGTAGRAQLDFSKGTLEIHKTGTDKLVYSVKETTLSTGTSGVSNDVNLWMVDGKATAVRLENVTTVLDYDTEYYVTMPAGFIKFADGTVSPAIVKGDWTFSTIAAAEEVECAAPVAKSGIFRFVSDIVGGGDIAYGYDYDETWFFNDSTQYQHDLVKMSIRAALAAYGAEGTKASPKNIEALMRDLEFSNIQSDYPKPTAETIGYAIGSKNIVSDKGEKCALLMVAVRGGGYYDEWGGNFKVGTGQEHAGFSDAADQVLKGIQDYLAAHKDDLQKGQKLWIVGYSRGAATANIVAKRLDDQAVSGISAEDVYAFCFECPQNTTDARRSSTKYNNIVNIVNPIDLVPKVVMSAWGYGRYGKTYYTPYRSGLISLTYSSQKTKLKASYEKILGPYHTDKITADELIPGRTIELALELDTIPDTLASIFENPDTFYHKYQDITMHAAARFFGAEWKDMSSEEKAQYFVSVLSDAVGVDMSFLLQFKSDDDQDDEEVGSTLFESHYGELCLAWLDSLEGEFSYADPKYRILFINCPVDVSVYDNAGTLVGKITDDKVQEIEDGIVASIDFDGQKVLAIPNGGEYRIEMTATDGGTVTYTATEYNMDSYTTEKLVSYFEVDVAKGDHLTGKAENLDANGTASYPLYLNNSTEPLTPDIEQTGDSVQMHTVIAAASGNGTVIGGGSYVSGEFAKVTANAYSGETFLGWYVNGALVSSDTEYRFLVDKNVNITARFTKNNTDFPGPSLPFGSNTDNSDFFYSISVSDSVTGGAMSVKPASASKDQLVTLTVKPDSGYKLGALNVSDSSGNKLELSDKGDGQYTFRMPASKVRVEVSFVPIEPAGPAVSARAFTDVQPGAYYYDAVQWAVEKGITNGTGDGTTFSPDLSCTRAQIVTFLWRDAGSPAPKGGGSGFTDVPDGQYYTDAVGWAIENGITNGTGDGTTFSPDMTCTRAQIAAFLWRAASSPEPKSTVIPFADVRSDAYYHKAVLWAVENRITLGTNEAGTTFCPDVDCTRAQIVTFLYRANHR